MTSPIDEILNLSLELSRLVRKKMMASFKPEEGLNLLQIYALSVIQEAGQLTMSDFARQLKISSSSATALADRLLKLDCLNRRADSANRRLVYLSIKPRGKRILLKSLSRKRKLLRPGLVQLSVPEQQQMRRILDKLVRAYSENSL